jgi:hypothetical protein
MWRSTPPPAAPRSRFPSKMGRCTWTCATTGRGGARKEGSGLLGLADRLAVLDGWLEVESRPGGGTHVAAAIPLRHA